MNITIKDIARLLNVSHTTVSRALNDSPLISADTKARIHEIAEKHNYTPNVNARSLVLSKTYNIGLFFTTLLKGTSANFFMETIRGVNEIIRDSYSLSVEGIDDFVDFSKINQRYFDGILLMSQSTDDDRLIAHLYKQNLPFVLMNRASDTITTTSVLADDKTGAQKATECLIKKGHKRIAVIMGKEEFKNTQRRKEGYVEAMRSYNLVIQDNYVVKGNYDLAGGYEAMMKLLQIEKLPTAVFCFNDDMAVGALKAINESNLKVPNDISLVGFDDSVIANYLTPALTTVSRPIDKIGAEGAKLLMEKINGGPEKNRTILLKTELKERDSVKSLIN